ncbi:hypothetical protein [Mycobacterium sp. DL592]|uniref:hypothetical protein n=1 Tax=Mycobacterium sp. DL592 TaxID=2675524 RepID=UPI00142285A9|nr:hypothetical protein [Mycobacterium sp. DL592]
MGTAALVLATAAVITPTAAHAAGIGNSVSGAVNSVVIPTAAASATTTCNPGDVGCYLVESVVSGVQTLVRGTVTFIGNVAYVLVDGTAQLLKLVSKVVGGPIGEFFSNVSDGVSAFGTSIALTFHAGPYQTGA